MLNVVLDDWVIKQLIVKLDFMIIHVLKPYPSSPYIEYILYQYVCFWYFLIFKWGNPCQKQTENWEFTTLHVCFPTIFMCQGTLLVTSCNAPTVLQIYARGEIARTMNKQYLTSSVLFKKASVFTQLPWGRPVSSSWFWKCVSCCFSVSGPVGHTHVPAL